MDETYTVTQRYETLPTGSDANAMLDKTAGALHDFVTVDQTTTSPDELLAFFSYRDHDHKLTIDLTGQQEEGFLLDVTIETRGDIDRDATKEALTRIETAIGVHFDHDVVNP